MGKVAVTYRVLPEGEQVDSEGLAAAVRTALGPAARDVAVRPLAFGLHAVEATVVVEDAAGASERIEERLRAMDGVGEVETLGVSLL